MKGKNIYLRAILKKNIFKNLLTAISIALGITLFVATSISAMSTKYFYNDYIGNRQSSADYIAIPKENATTQLNSLNKIEGIAKILPYSESECYIDVDGDLSGFMKIAVDPQAEVKQGSLMLLDGKLPQNGECLITKTVKQIFKLAIGEKINIRTVEGNKSYTITGIVQNSGIVLKNSGQCIVTNITKNSSVPGEYKIILSDKKNEMLKKQVNSILKKDFVLQDPKTKSTTFDKEINSFFNIFYVVSLLSLGIGYYLVAVTINKYMFILKARFALLKVCGWVKSDIYILVGELGALICLTGVAFGLVLGFFVSKIMLQIVTKILNIDKIPIIFPMQAIVFGIIGCILFGVGMSCILANKLANESIVEGMQKYPERQKSLNKKSTYMLGVICIICVTSIKVFKYNTAMLFILQIIGILFFACLIIRLVFKKYILIIINRAFIFTDYCKVLAKSNLLKNLKNNLKTFTLYVSMIVFVVAISCTFAQFKDALDKMVDGSYFGDAVIDSVVGAAITIPDLKEINNLSQVQASYPLYESYFNLDRLNIQLNGYTLDKINKDHLVKYMELDSETLKLLEKKNTVILSDFVMKKSNLAIGDSIDINGCNFKIVGKYSSMNNDGKSGITDMDNFISAIKNYKIRYINIVLKDNSNFARFKKEFKQGIKDPYIEVKNVDEMKGMDKSNNNQILYLLNGIVIIILLSVVLMLTNSIIFELYNNQYTLATLKALGSRKSMLIQQQVLSACIKGVFASLLGVMLSIPVNYSLVNVLNKVLEWNITFNFKWKEYINFGAMFLIIMIFSELLAILVMYNKISVLDAVNGE